MCVVFVFCGIFGLMFVLLIVGGLVGCVGRIELYVIKVLCVGLVMVCEW